MSSALCSIERTVAEEWSQLQCACPCIQITHKVTHVYLIVFKNCKFCTSTSDRRGRVSVVWCAPSCLRATFSRDTTAVVVHNVGRAASSEVCGRRIMNPVGNTLYRHSHAGTSSDEPLEEEDAPREEAERSAVATDTPGRIDAWSAVGIDTPLTLV